MNPVDEHGNMFESSVILEGSKTKKENGEKLMVFESSVILEGSKTKIHRDRVIDMFESSVILEGSKTYCLMCPG